MKKNYSKQNIAGRTGGNTAGIGQTVVHRLFLECLFGHHPTYCIRVSGGYAFGYPASGFQCRKVVAGGSFGTGDYFDEGSAGGFCGGDFPHLVGFR